MTTDKSNESGNGDDHSCQSAGNDSMLEKVMTRKRKIDRKLDDKKKPDKLKITSTFVQECLYSNELGDGMLYAHIHSGRFVFNKSIGEWMSWTGHYWKIDIMGAALVAVEDVVCKYLDELKKINIAIAHASDTSNKDALSEFQQIQKEIFKRVKKLRSDRGRVACLKFAHTCSNGLGVEGDLFDRNPWLLGCQNGVVDLRTGELRPGRPADYISKASPYDYTGFDAPAPIWEKTLDEIFEGDAEISSFLQRLFGYAITGLSLLHIIIILLGQGRNGKGMIIGIIMKILGPLAGPIPSEMLLDQGRVRNSAGPSPDIASLRGLRVAFASETDEGKKFSTSRVKWLSGGDILTARSPHDKYPVVFEPTHTLFLLTNHKPIVSAYDFGFWERVYIIPFGLSFLDREPQAENERRADSDLPKKLESEISGIFAWLVRGCLKFQQIGLCPPKAVLKATDEYRREEDVLADFIESECEISKNASESAADLYDAFKKWCEEHVSKRNIISQKKFGMMMTRKFHKEKSGVMKYFGIKLLNTNFGG